MITNRKREYKNEYDVRQKKTIRQQYNIQCDIWRDKKETNCKIKKTRGELPT